MMRSTIVLASCLLLTGACASPRSALPTENAALASDGVSIRYRSAGRDKPEPTIVLVHGFGGDATFWDAQIAHLSKEHRVLALDLPGHGKSGTDRVDNWTMEAFGDDVRAVCDEAGASSIILIGHSMGGPVILEAAHLMPDRVLVLVAVETFHDVENRMSEEILQQLTQELAADYPTAVERMTRQFLFTPDADTQIVETVVARMRSLPPDVAIALMESMSRYDVAQSLEQVHVPIRCINTTELMPNVVESAKRHAQDFELRTMDGVSHYPMMEAPDRFNELLDEVIAEGMGAARKTSSAQP